MGGSLEEKLIPQRERMRSSILELEKRVENSSRGDKTKDVLRKVLRYESPGNVGFFQYDAPPVIIKGKGATLVDIDGKEYIDLLAGFGVSNVGHSHPRVVETIKDQAGQLIHYFDYPSPQRARLAERICRLTPGDFSKRVAFTVTGSDAIEMAIRISRWYSGGQFIITAYGDYHGTQIGTMGLTGKARMWAYYYPIPPADIGVIRVPYAYCYRCPFDKVYPDCDIFCVKFLEYILNSEEGCYRSPADNISNIAALIIEPMQSSAGYIIPPIEYIQGLKELCDRYGILFVSDEIQAGMGRTGKWFAIENYGVAPDVITVAKGIGGGFALSMAVGRAEIFESWGPGAHVSTFAGSHLACAVANTVLDIIENEGILDHVEEVGKYFLTGLNELAKQHLIVGEVRGKGLYIGIELVRNQETREPADKEATYIHSECFKEGMLLQKSGYFSNRLTLIPPLVITKREIDEVLKIFDRVFTKAEELFNLKKVKVTTGVNPK